MVADAALDDGRVRLVLSDQRAGESVLDGAWWPRTRKPLVEFPLLMAEVIAVIGDVERMSLSGSGWLTTPREIPFDRHRVDICWFNPNDQHEVVVLAKNDLVLDLLLIPPAAAPIAAMAAMAAASRGTSAARGSQVLVNHGVLLGRSADPPCPDPRFGSA
ncbi:DUF5994 family protein [Cryptosporangium arvum]|uniref:Uncharacterized protein n=1 Tax=Cryptosporangium arvum DSM 44712 TaxID=927661 RepID=A0A010ZPT6_9ACTN|nr:DUF5994 family protein [Cryptosporangium arvum]EXG79222.1 hypothetical protein CryarDRAFT_0251 [Cryptosporangium arvum DSM 44712]